MFALAGQNSHRSARADFQPRDGTSTAPAAPEVAACFTAVHDLNITVSRRPPPSITQDLDGIKVHRGPVSPPHDSTPPSTAR